LPDPQRHVAFALPNRARLQGEAVDAGKKRMRVWKLNPPTNSQLAAAFLAELV